MTETDMNPKDKSLSECAGYQSLMAAVQKDCSNGENCFNPNGCPVKGYAKCTHRYCDKLVWAVSRANHYAEKTGIPATEILGAWEKKRDYWYMNYYQECRQPIIKDGQVKVFETLDQYMQSLNSQGFRCPACGHESKNPYECDSGECDWKAYGLFGTLGKGITVFVKENLAMAEIFMPVAWDLEASQ